MARNGITQDSYAFAIALGSLAVGFILPFWPFIVIGTLGAIWSNHVFVALAAAFIFDLLFGEGVGLLPIDFPMTVSTSIAVLLFASLKRYMRSRS